MATRANFEIITFNSHLGDNVADLNVPWATFQGDESSEESFFIEQPPSGPGYIILKAFNVDNDNHRIVINGQNLGGVDIRSDTGWQTWMDVIDSGILQQGDNTIQFQRASGGDNFAISNVAIHWREEVPT